MIVPLGWFEEEKMLRSVGLMSCVIGATLASQLLMNNGHWRRRSSHWCAANQNSRARASRSRANFISIGLRAPFNNSGACRRITTSRSINEWNSQSINKRVAIPLWTVIFYTTTQKRESITSRNLISTVNSSDFLHNNSNLESIRSKNLN